MNELDAIDDEDTEDAGNALQSELWLQLWGYACLLYTSDAADE